MDRNTEKKIYAILLTTANFVQENFRSWIRENHVYAGFDVFDQLDKIRVPLLLFHGDDDKIVPVSGSRMLIEKVGSSYKKYVEFKGGYHHLQVEPDGIRENMELNICEWLEAHTSQ